MRLLTSVSDVDIVKKADGELFLPNVDNLYEDKFHVNISAAFFAEN